MRLAVFGLGSIGMRHVRNLLEMGETDIFGCDPRIGEGGFSCTPIQGTNNAEMVWQWKPEAVLICTPPEEHWWVAEGALLHLAHVFVEKPVASTLSEAAALLLTSQFGASKKKVVAVGYQLRWQIDNLPSNRDMAWECSQDMSQWPSQYPKDVLLEFSHEIDAACYLNGPVEAVCAFQEPNGWEIRLRHLSNWSVIRLNPFSKNRKRKAYELTSGNLVWEFNEAANASAYRSELSAFLAACQGDQLDPRLCTLPQAVHVMKIIEACRRSVECYEVVKL